MNRKIGPFRVKTVVNNPNTYAEDCYKTTITDTRSTTKRVFYTNTESGAAWRVLSLLEDLTKDDDEFAALATLGETL